MWLARRFAERAGWRFHDKTCQKLQQINEDVHFDSHIFFVTSVFPHRIVEIITFEDVSCFFVCVSWCCFFPASRRSPLRKLVKHRHRPKAQGMKRWNDGSDPFKLNEINQLVSCCWWKNTDFLGRWSITHLSMDLTWSGMFNLNTKIYTNL